MAKKTVMSLGSTTVEVEIIKENGNGTTTVRNLAGAVFDAPSSTISEEEIHVASSSPNPPNNPKNNNNNTPLKKEYKDIMKDFFNISDGSLKSFDVETTGLSFNDKDLLRRDRIWQTGFSELGVDGTDVHINPFYTKNVNGVMEEFKNGSLSMVDSELRKKGSFITKALEEGKMDTLLFQYGTGSLTSLDDAISEVSSRINSRDVIVLQNMNFENNMLRSSVEQGILSESVYEELASKLETTQVDDKGKTIGLFQSPENVQRYGRRADFVYHTQFLKNGDQGKWDEYLENTNKSLESYFEEINNPKRNKAVVVELLDVTKAFYANAADKGHIEKGTTTLGLNIDFLANTILGEKETHTAFSDADQTNRLFLDISQMTKEIREGNESDHTKSVLKKIKEKQPEEVNKKFLSSIRSVVSDFSIKRQTKDLSSTSWYSPEVLLKKQETDGLISTSVLEEKSTRRGNNRIYKLEVALKSVLERYAVYEKDLYGFNREDYVENLLKENPTKSYKNIITQVDQDIERYTPDFSKQPPEKIVREPSLPVSEKKVTEKEVSFLGVNMKEKTRNKVLIGGALGLGAMAMTTRPTPVEQDTSNVSENFYDEQYLGTAFVDFKERNKHYMM